MACAHGCVYCDGRAERYYVDGQFDRDIIVRENLPALLAAELPKLREKGVISIGSGITDAYQPAEASERVMRRCAEVLAEHEFPVTVMTKSALIERDLDVWSRVNQTAGFMLVMSLTHVHDFTRLGTEPGASTVAQRIATLERFRKAGCAVGVLALPLLPGITDTAEHTRVLYQSLSAVDPLFVMPGGLTLRPGRQKQLFMQYVAEHYPQLLDRYAKLYGEERPSGAPRSNYTRELTTRLSALNTEFALPFLVPHQWYRGRLHRFDEINVLMRHLIELYADHDTKPLRAAATRYTAWLTERKAVYNRRRSLDYAELDIELQSALAGGELAQVLSNAKLTDFVRRVLSEDVVFDYVSRTLIPAAR